MITLSVLGIICLFSGASALVGSMLGVGLCLVFLLWEDEMTYRENRKTLAEGRKRKRKGGRHR